MSASSDLMLGDAGQVLAEEFGTENPLVHSSGRHSFSKTQRRPSRTSSSDVRECCLILYHQSYCYVSFSCQKPSDYSPPAGEWVQKEEIIPEEDSLVAPDPPDAEGRPSRLLNVAGFIIVTEFCERLAYYGFAGSLVLFFQVLN